MFGPLGFPEVLFILALALLIFGPRKLPEIGRTIGRGIAEFRKASTELKRSLNTEMIEEELRQSDPRKIMRESLEQTSGEPESSEEPESSDEPESPDAPEALDEPEAVESTSTKTAPDGTVARAGSEATAGETTTEPEAQ